MLLVRDDRHVGGQLKIVDDVSQRVVLDGGGVVDLCALFVLPAAHHERPAAPEGLQEASGLIGLHPQVERGHSLPGPRTSRVGLGHDARQIGGTEVGLQALANPFERLLEPSRVG